MGDAIKTGRRYSEIVGTDPAPEFLEAEAARQLGQMVTEVNNLCELLPGNTQNVS
jgi:hypothetical protein